MNKDEALARLKEHYMPDLEDFITDNRLDLAKAHERGKLHLVQALDLKDGMVTSIRLTSGVELADTYVYLIKAANGLVKIGVTRDINKRFSKIKSGSPIDVELIGSVLTATGRELERRLHQEFEAKRIRGEWFALDDQDVNRILEKWLPD